MSDNWHNEWTARVLVKHADAVEAGEHDNECEWRPNGHFICNCRARKRIAAGFTEPPGELIHQYPICPRCDDEVHHNGDSFECPRCNCYWPSDGGPAVFNDDYGDLSEGVALYEAKEREAS